MHYKKSQKTFPLYCCFNSKRHCLSCVQFRIYEMSKYPLILLPYFVSGVEFFKIGNAFENENVTNLKYDRKIKT